MSEEELGTLQRIHEVAAKEFLEKGFRGASLRSMMKTLGMTTGAFYGYYKSKEELFAALVREHYEQILRMYDDTLAAFWLLSPEEQQEHMEDIGGECMERMVEYMYDHVTAFKLLLTAASGTEFENLAHELTLREIDSTHEFERQMASIGYPMSEPIEPALEHSITSGMFTGMFELLIHDVPRDKARLCVRRLHAFHNAGWRVLMNM